MASLLPAGFDGRIGTLLPRAEAIHRIKLNSVDPQRYLTDLLTRLHEGWPKTPNHDLKPRSTAKTGQA